MAHAWPNLVQPNVPSITKVGETVQGLSDAANLHERGPSPRPPRTRTLPLPHQPEVAVHQRVHRRVLEKSWIARSGSS